jgi:hypothetical protein
VLHKQSVVFLHERQPQRLFWFTSRSAVGRGVGSSEGEKKTWAAHEPCVRIPQALSGAVGDVMAGTRKTFRRRVTGSERPVRPAMREWAAGRPRRRRVARPARPLTCRGQRHACGRGDTCGPWPWNGPCLCKSRRVAVGQKHHQHLILYWAHGWKLLGQSVWSPLDESLCCCPVLWWWWWTTEPLQRRQVGLLVRRQNSEVDFAI